MRRNFSLRGKLANKPVWSHSTGHTVKLLHVFTSVLGCYHHLAPPLGHAFELILDYIHEGGEISKRNSLDG